MIYFEGMQHKAYPYFYTAAGFLILHSLHNIGMQVIYFLQLANNSEFIIKFVINPLKTPLTKCYDSYVSYFSNLHNFFRQGSTGTKEGD